MRELATSNGVGAKVIRVILVFTLVFWASFRAECLAFAALGVDAGQHENEALSGMKLYELDHAGGNASLGKELGDVSRGEGASLTDVKLGEGSTMQAVAVAAWKALPASSDEPSSPASPDPEKGDASEDGKSQGGASGKPDSDDEDKGDDGEKPSDSEDEPSDEPVTRGVPSPLATQADDEALAARFVTWKAEGEGSDVVAIEVNEDTGVATITGVKPGSAVVKCSLAEGYDKRVSEDFAGSFEASFRVTVVSAPYVSSIELYQAPETDGQDPFKPSEEIVLSDEEREAFGFWALVNVYDEASDNTYKYRITPGESLKARSDGKFADLKWSVLSEGGDEVGDDIAQISSDGVLALTGDVPVRVRCSSDNGLNGDPVSQEVIVYSEKARDEQERQKDDIQGASNPQEKLTVVLDDPAATKAADQDAEADPAASGSDAASGQSETEDEGNPAETQDNPLAEPSEEGGTQDGKEASGEGEQSEGEKLLKTFAKGEGSRLVEVLDGGELGEPLALQEETYSMNTATGGTTVVEGKGAFLGELLSRMGLEKEDLDRIDSIEFVSAESGLHSYDWSQVTAVSGHYIMIATESYVHELDGQKATQAEADASPVVEDVSPTSPEPHAGEPAEEPASGPSAKAQLLDNTRFRILFESAQSDIDPLDLRYVNQIIIHMKETAPQPEDLTDPELDIGIDYVPVPYGKQAFLSAVPNDKVGASRFGYTWELSTDGGTTWTVLSDESVQTLRVMTANPPDGHIGHMYRVVLETDLLNEDGSVRGATSKPVEIRASDEFSVVLDYVPDFAGNTAIFTSHLYNAEGVSEGDITYAWEYNQGNGWDPIPGADQRSSSWSTPTNPIDETAESSAPSDAESATMTYIRVRVMAPGKEPVVSNTQPLTVRVGESGGSSKADDIGKALDGTGSAEGEDTGDAVSDDGAATDKPSKKRKIREIDSPVVEESHSSMTDYFEDGVTTDPTVGGDFTELVINEDVSEKIKAQNEAVKAQAESKTPGARWTELTTLNPTDEDMQRIFGDNPFAPFAFPLGLGVVVAGGLEKLLTFRRQL